MRSLPLSNLLRSYMKSSVTPAVSEGLCMHAEAKPAEKVPERRLWLTGSMESSPGVCGLYRTARTEPMGDRLRLLYKGDCRLSWGKPQDQEGALAQALRSRLGLRALRAAAYQETSHLAPAPSEEHCQLPSPPHGTSRLELL